MADNREGNVSVPESILLRRREQGGNVVDNWYRWVLAVGSAVASYLFGGWSALLGVLLTFMVVDYVSGVVAAAITGQLSSARGLRGIAKKVGIFAMVAIAHLADSVLGEANLLRDATIFFYLANELLSVIENFGRIGVPIPPVITRAVEVLKGKADAK